MSWETTHRNKEKEETDSVLFESEGKILESEKWKSEGSYCQE
jgi:hypothetical protein